MKAYMNQVSNFLYRSFIEPRSNDSDSRRREFILNVLLSGLLLSSSVSLLYTIIAEVISNEYHYSSSIWTGTMFWLVCVGLVYGARHGRQQLVAYIFTGFLLVGSALLALTWGFGFADVELLFALTIVIAGVLFKASRALLATLAVAIVLLTITVLQVQHIQQPNISWQKQTFQPGDAIGYIIIFVLMGVVSWLSNREIDHSLQRALASEKALEKERDNLELAVAARTRELEQLQLTRLLEMQPFAEFGRIGAGLVHEIANPLTAASLHLQQLDSEQNSELVHQIQRNLHRLEQYLLAARKQIKRESRLTSFAVSTELRQITNLLSDRAHKAGVVIVTEKVGRIRLYGDVVKFNQIIANLLANAIEASEPMTDPLRREILLQAYIQDEYLHVLVSDHGIGIKPSRMEHLFEPFYSTKTKSLRQGLGIGLTMVKQYVEQDFQGSITVTSSKQDGTVFALKLRDHKK